MNLLNIVLVGLVATAYMLGFNWAAVRLGLIRGPMIRAVGSLVIPEKFYSPATRVLFNLFVGVLFAAVYAYVFSFVNPPTVRASIELGLLIGFVHGAFVSFFFGMGLSSVQMGDEVRPFTFAAAGINTLSHLLFGALIGVCLGSLAVHGTAMWSVGYLALGWAAVGAIVMLLHPQPIRPKARLARLARPRSHRIR